MRAARLLVLLLALAGPAAAQPISAAPQGAAPTILDEVWRAVNEHFYDPRFGGHDWAALGDAYRDLARETAPPALPALINRMLGELGASHTAYLTADDAAYYDIADIFSGALRRELPRIFADGEVSYVGIGALTQKRDGKLFVYGLPAGLPAERAGLKTGDEIVAADDA